MKKGVKNTSVDWLTHFRAHMQTLFANMIDADMRLPSSPTIPKEKRSLKKKTKPAEGRSNLHIVALKAAFWSASPCVITSTWFLASYVMFL